MLFRLEFSILLKSKKNFRNLETLAAHLAVVMSLCDQMIYHDDNQNIPTTNPSHMALCNTPKCYLFSLRVNQKIAHPEYHYDESI